MIAKGIILAGGAGTRLHPVTIAVSKQLLPVYDKPMIYYSLCTLLLAGIRDVLLISTPVDLPMFQRLLGDGSQWESRSHTPSSRVPKVWHRRSSSVGTSWGRGRPPSCWGQYFLRPRLPEQLRLAAARTGGATVFAYRVRDPERYGVVQFNESGRAIDIEESQSSPSRISRSPACTSTTTMCSISRRHCARPPAVS